MHFWTSEYSNQSTLTLLDSLTVMTSKDGYSWTEAQGLKAGIPTIGLIQPPTNVKDQQATYDVVIVGAGYTGLTAARDATLAGMYPRFRHGLSSH